MLAFGDALEEMNETYFNHLCSILFKQFKQNVKKMFF